MHTPALSPPSASQDISVSRFISSTAGGDSHHLVGLLIFGVQNTTEKLFRCDTKQSSFIGTRNASASSEADGIDISAIDTTPLKNLSAYISLIKLQGGMSEDSYLTTVQNNCEQIIEQQNMAQQTSVFSSYLSARSIAATSNREFNEAIAQAHDQQHTRLADTLIRLRFNKDQITGQEQKIAENHAKPFLRASLTITSGEIDLAGLNRLYDKKPD